MYKRGQTLKLSKEGLDWLAEKDGGKRAKLATLRFQYHCPAKKTPECLSVNRVGRLYYETYHHTFLELA